MTTSLRSVFAFACLSLAALVACSSDDAASGKSAADSCKDMCTSAGFTSSRVDEQPNETNCFCTGSGTITPAACTSMCSGLGKAKSQPFTSNSPTANACQCSP